MTYREILEKAERQRRAEPTGRTVAPLIAAVALGFALLAVALMLSSCSTVSPVAASGPLDGVKRGTATTWKVCGFVLRGDGSTRAAALDGGVRFVQTVDVKRTSVCGLVTWSTTIVTGE